MQHFLPAGCEMYCESSLSSHSAEEEDVKVKVKSMLSIQTVTSVSYTSDLQFTFT